MNAAQKDLARAIYKAACHNKKYERRSNYIARKLKLVSPEKMVLVDLANMYNAVKMALHFDRVIDAAIKDNAQWELEALEETVALIKQKIERRDRVRALRQPPEWANAQKMVGRNVSPFVATTKLTKQQKFLQGCEFVCTGVGIKSRIWKGHTVFSCIVVSNPACTLTARIAKNELIGMTYNFNKVV
jgi:hypothetical protein